MLPRVTGCSIDRVEGSALHDSSDVVATEEPLEVRLGFPLGDGRVHKSISVTMRTPGDDYVLAIGFLLSEGIIKSPEDIDSVQHCGPAVGDKKLRNVVRVELRSNIESELQRLERHFYTTSSCGVCGKTSLEALRTQAQWSLADNAFSVVPDALYRLPAQLRQAQQVFAQTGGIHAAGLFDAAGDLVAINEDVGRHNALDKLIGTLFLAEKLPLRNYGILVSGRASFELLQKASMAGCPLLAAIGAPSSLAIELAQEFDMTLIGFLRDGRFNIYSGAVRLQA